MPKKDYNFGCLGLAFIGFGAANFIVFLLTGSGIGSRMNHRASGDLAILGSIAFLVLGCLAIVVWLAIKLVRGMRG